MTSPLRAPSPFEAPETSGGAASADLDRRAVVHRAFTSRAALAALVVSALALGPHPREATRPAPAAAWAPLALPAPIAALLATGRWDTTPYGFRIVALSFLADGCVAAAERDAALRDAARACVDRALRLADRLRPRSAGDPTDHGLWASHFTLILGARDRLGGCRDPSRHRALAEALAARTLREPTRHVPSYPATRLRWPADQTATLAALARHDRAHGTRLADAPTNAWRAWVQAQAMDPKLGLPWSEATGRGTGARSPRGCALSWQTRYLREIDPALAARWWERYREHYLVDRALIVGFREWPSGEAHPADEDSGPIVNDVGVAATALAIPAARAMGDDVLANRIEATAKLVEATIGADPKLRRDANTVLATSIRYLGRELREEQF